MSSERLDVKLTARFKFDGKIDESLFEKYKRIVNELLDYADSKGITSFKRLRAEKRVKAELSFIIPLHHSLSNGLFYL